jgi:hypothetical protein
MTLKEIQIFGTYSISVFTNSDSVNGGTELIINWQNENYV